MQGNVRKRGDQWYYSFESSRIEGKRKRVERVGGRTKKDAETALRKALEEYETIGQVIDDSNLSIGDYMDYWFTHYVEVNLKYNTKQWYSNIIRNHIKPSIGQYKLKALKPAVLQQFLNKKSLEGLSKSSVSSFYGILAKSLRMAVYPYQFIKSNPMSYVSMPKYNQQPKDNSLKIIETSDFECIIDRFPRGSSFYIPIQISYNTGLRAGEVCGLTWNHIDLDNKTIRVDRTMICKSMGRVEFGTPKTMSSIRTVDITDSLVNKLKDHLEDQNRNKEKYGPYYTCTTSVCTKENGELITTDSLKYLSRVVNYELGITFNFHSLRHTHASRLLAAGANIKAIQTRLGHARIATTMDTYAHITQDLKDSTIDLLERLSKLNSDLPTS